MYTLETFEQKLTRESEARTQMCYRHNSQHNPRHLTLLRCGTHPTVMPGITREKFQGIRMINKKVP